MYSIQHTWMIDLMSLCWLLFLGVFYAAFKCIGLMFIFIYSFGFLIASSSSDWNWKVSWAAQHHFPCGPNTFICILFGSDIEAHWLWIIGPCAGCECVRVSQPLCRLYYICNAACTNNGKNLIKFTCVNPCWHLEFIVYMVCVLFFTLLCSALLIQPTTWKNHRVPSLLC